MEEQRQLERDAEEVFHPQRKLRRTIYLLPSIFTVGNLFAGFFALIATLNGNYQAAAIAIGIAVVLDGLDGRVARMANATSDFGLQLDSLADVISFGISPAVLMYAWGLADLGNFARLSAFVFVVCGAMRLARFNVQNKNLKSFAGLPIPAAAGYVAATVHLLTTPLDANFFKYYLIAITYVLSLLMISTLRYPSLKHLNLGRGKSHITVLALALIVAGIFFYSQQVLMAIAFVYVVSGPVMRIHQLVKRRNRDAELPATEIGHE
jgi:CDP-diacylglycerol---serine O-phosphatidyltransferase